MQVEPYRVPKSGSLRGIDRSRSEEVVANVKRALEYMGHRVELWDLEIWND
jgi:hypothetical protein